MSKVFGRPNYQYGPGVGDVHRRHIADVALDADPQSGYSILFDSKWGQFGGTSVAAPAWAALWVVANEAAGQRLGPANPAIYRAARSPDYGKMFYDVSWGDDGAGLGTGYPAAIGYDHPTGWGTPNATEFVAWLAASAPQAVTPVAPATPLPGLPAIPAPPQDEAQPKNAPESKGVAQ